MTFHDIKFALRKNIPIGIKRIFFNRIHRGVKYYCNVCNSMLKEFLPGGIDLPLFEEYMIIGGGYHIHDSCPVCKASYRERLIKLMLDQTSLLSKGMRILHVAPEECFFYLLRKSSRQKYVCGDLDPKRYSYYANPVQLDLLNLEFSSNSFNLVFCNHVLEHIPDDHKAMAEIFRVLDLGGKAILQVPISGKLEETYEEESVQSDQDRLKKFGQRDHVRIYGQDYIKRLESAGFTVEVFNPNHYAHSVNFDKMALDLQERVFIATKK